MRCSRGHSATLDIQRLRRPFGGGLGFPSISGFHASDCATGHPVLTVNEQHGTARWNTEAPDLADGTSPILAIDSFSEIPSSLSPAPRDAGFHN